MPHTVAISTSPFADEYVGHQGRPQLYPWESFFNGKLWVIETERSYGRTPETFRSIAKSAARKYGVKLVSKVEGDVLYLLAPEVE